MNISDPIADMLARIRGQSLAGGGMIERVEAAGHAVGGEIAVHDGDVVAVTHGPQGSQEIG